jgi:hypothetical protein
LKPSPLLATSIFALFAAGVGPGQSGGCANEISVDFAGPVDWASVATSAAPTLFSEMATGTKPDEDFASTAAGTAQLGAVDKARAAGRAIIAPLIGTSGNGSALGEVPGVTVFVAAGSQIGFSDGGDIASGSSGTHTLTPGGSRTATITVVSGMNLSRVGWGRPPNFPFANSDPHAVATGGLAEKAQPDAGNHARPVTLGEKANLMAANFSDAVTVTMRLAAPTPWEVRGSVAIFDRRATKGVQPIIGFRAYTTHSGAKGLFSASVGANPRAEIARYLTAVVDPLLENPIIEAVEGFQVRLSASLSSSGNDIATVYNSLIGKIPATVGALNNSLALP